MTQLHARWHTHSLARYFLQRFYLGNALHQVGRILITVLLDGHALPVRDAQAGDTPWRRNMPALRGEESLDRP
jgi:hypothetical protein